MYTLRLSEYNILHGVARAIYEDNLAAIGLDVGLSPRLYATLALSPFGKTCKLSEKGWLNMV